MPDYREITDADLDAVAAWTIIRAARQASRILTVALRPYDLTPMEFGILAQLAAADGELTQAEVARAAKIRPQSAAPVIEALGDRGLLGHQGERGRGHSGRLVLTEAGAVLVGEALPAVASTNGQIFGDGRATERTNTVLLKLLSRVQNAKDPSFLD